MPPNPLVTARSFTSRNMYIQKPKNFRVGPPLRNPAHAPAMLYKG